MFYMFMDFVIIILEVVCCQMFFDVFHYEGRSNKRLFTKKFTAVWGTKLYSHLQKKKQGLTILQNL